MKYLIVVLSYFFINYLTAQNDTNTIIKLNQLAWGIKNNNVDSAVILSSKALQLLTTNGATKKYSKNWEEKSLSKTYYYLGVFYYYKNNQKTALYYFNKSLVFASKTNHQFITAQVYSSIGNLYLDQGLFPKALEFYTKALKIDEARGFKKGIATHLANIGNIYHDKKKCEKALEYYTKALNIAIEINDEERMAIQYGNIGVTYNLQNNYNKAQAFYLKSLSIHKKLNNKKQQINILSNLANLYKDQKNYDLAMNNLTEVLAIEQQLGLESGITIGNMGIIHLNKENFKLAKIYLDSAILISEKINDVLSLQEFEGELSKIYCHEGNYKLALLHYKKEIGYKDTMYSEENTKKLTETELNYEFDKKEMATKVQNDKIIYQLEVDNKLQKQWRLFFIVIIIVTLVGLFFMKRAFDNKKKLAIVLAAEDQRKEVLLQEVHHRINNNLQIISSLLTLQANNADNEKLTEYLTQSQNRIQSLAAMHELLFDTNSPLEINMNDYLEKVLDFHRTVSSTMHGKINFKVSVDNVFFPTKLAVPLALIVNELVTNAIKYAFDKTMDGLIQIKLKKNINTNNWQLSISDNGKGLPPEGEKRKDSLGLKLVSIMTKQIKGTLTLGNNKGAEFNIVFDLKK